MNLDELLQIWVVLGPDSSRDPRHVVGWWAVANQNGVLAYFHDRTDAHRWRLDMINRTLHP